MALLFAVQAFQQPPFMVLDEALYGPRVGKEGSGVRKAPPATADR